MPNLLPFNPTPSFPSSGELAAILVPLPPAAPTSRLVLSMDRQVATLDPATQAAQSMPRQDGGLGAALWDMFNQTHRPV